MLMLRKAALGFLMFVCACAEVTTAPEPSPARLDPGLLPGYYADTVLWHAPTYFTGMGDKPVDGCVESRMERIVESPHYLKPSVMDYTAEWIGSSLCPDSRNNQFTFAVSPIKIVGNSFVYQITLAADAIIYTGFMVDSLRQIGNINLSQTKTSVGSWRSVRLVPDSAAKAALDKMFDSPNFRPGSYSAEEVRRMFPEVYRRFPAFFSI